MKSRNDIESSALFAAREYGIGTIFFRNTLAKSLGLNLTESLCLTILGIRGESTPTELARFTGLTTGATTTMLDRLEKRKFIRRRPNPRDRRGIIVEIDETYAESARGLVEGIQKANRELVAKFSDSDLIVAAEFLNGLAANLSTESKRIEEGSVGGRG